jgi:hypothetical protein
MAKRIFLKEGGLSGVSPTGYKILGINDGGSLSLITGNTSSEVVNFKTIKVSLDSSQLSSLATSPINTGIPTPSVGDAIFVVSAYVKYTFVSVTPSFTAIELGDGTGNAQFVWNGVDVQNVFSPMIPSDVSGNPIVDNQPLLIRANSDTVSGDAYADVYITYQILTI